MAQVSCPKCSTALKLPNDFTSGNVKCPKCALILAVNQQLAVNQENIPATHKTQDPLRQDDPFADLSQIPIPASQPKATPRNPVTKRSTSKKSNQSHNKKKKSSDSRLVAFGKSLFRIALLTSILAAIVLLLHRYGVFGEPPKKWVATEFRQVEINMPIETVTAYRSGLVSGLAIDEMHGKMQETGSLFVVGIAYFGNSSSPDDDIRKQFDVFANEIADKIESIERDSVKGYKGRPKDTPTESKSEIETFLFKNRIIVATYIPYSTLKELASEKLELRDVHKSEQSVDRPDEFFSSIRFLRNNSTN